VAAPTEHEPHITEVGETQKSTTAAKLRWLLVVGLLAASLVSFAMGSLAVVIGRGLNDWGKGAGGLGGSVNEFMTYFSYVVGLAAAIATFKERHTILVPTAVFATGLIISTGFLDLAHLADPCVRGWWDFSTNVGDTRMCSASGEIADRFHLVIHGTFGVLAAGAATAIYRRRNLFEWWPLASTPTSEQSSD
jgi:hypothetical protein